MRITLATLLLLAYTTVYAMTGSATELTITNVSPDRTVLRKGEAPIMIGFRLSAPARVTLDIYDARDLLVRSIRTSAVLPQGDHTLQWNGLDERGDYVPTESYFYTLTARSNQGDLIRFDLSDTTGGETVTVEKIEYYPEDQVIRYELPATARVFLRVGILKGSVLRTVVNGAIRQAGVIEEPWDGYDESRVVSIGSHPKLQLFAEGFKLSRNALIVINDDPYPVRPRWIPEITNDAPRRPGQDRAKGQNVHAYHHRDQCRDAKISLRLPDNLPRNGDGIPIISGPVPLRMEVSEEDADMVESQRFEVVYFLNNRLVYENEVSYTPYTWIWEPKALNGEINYMTAFIVGFGRHFGVSTVKFMLQESPIVQ